MNPIRTLGKSTWGGAARAGLVTAVVLAGQLQSTVVHGQDMQLGAVEMTSPKQHLQPGEQVQLTLTAELNQTPYELTVYQPEGFRQPYRVRARGSDGRVIEMPDARVHYVSLTPGVATMNGRGEVRAREVGAATVQARVFLGDQVRTTQLNLGVPERLLTEHDFVLDGEHGSYGSSVQQVGENHFVYQSGHHPLDESRVSGVYFRIPSGFRGNTLTIDMPGGAPVEGHNFTRAYSFDGRNWTPILQEVIEASEEGVSGDLDAQGVRSRITIAPSESDALYFGGQIPLSYELGRDLFREWASDPKTAPFVTIHEVGVSLEGRKLLRMEVTDPTSPHPREDRWGHYILSAHPHEGKARWRVVGAIDWLLSDDPVAVDARRRQIWHFVLMVNPDGVNNGWSRMNLENLDTNRTFRAGGPLREEQSHEGYIFQQDVTNLVNSETPLTTFWDWHVWWGPVEPMMHPGPEFGTGAGKLGEWTEFRDLIERYDVDDLILPVATRDPEGGTLVWDTGVHREFGITASLVEGSGELDTQEESMEAGAILARSIAEFYRGTRADLR